MAVQGISVYAWTLAVPMIVRVQWLWARQQPPVSVISFLPDVDPWLPLTASAAMVFRLWLSVQAKGKLDASGIIAARNEMLALDRKTATGVTSAVLGALGSAVLVIALICGLFDSVARGAWVFAIVAGLFLVRNLVLPTLSAWAWWSQAVNRVPLLLRWMVAVAGTFMVTRLIVSNPAYSPAHNLTPGAFGVEIFCFLLGLAASVVLIPAPVETAAPLVPTPTARMGAKTFAFAFILALATRAAYADVCLDPFCCFGGNPESAALVIAALALLALPFLLESAAALAAIDAAIEAAELLGTLSETAEGVLAEEEAALSESEAAAELMAEPGAAEPTSDVFPNFNPEDGTQNCGACADSVDNYLGGEGIEPAEGDKPRGWPQNAPPKSFTFGESPASIEEALQNAGDGSRGIIYVGDGASGAHVFNAVNVGGEVIAIDGQTGVFGSISDVATASGWGDASIWGWSFTAL